MPYFCDAGLHSGFLRPCLEWEGGWVWWVSKQVHGTVLCTQHRCLLVCWAVGWIKAFFLCITLHTSLFPDLMLLFPLPGHGLITIMPPPLISVWLPKEKKLPHKGNSSFSHTLLEWQVGTACLCFSGGSILPRKKLKTDCAPYSKCLYSPRKTLFIQHCETYYYFPPHLACPLHDQSHMKISDKIRHSGKTRHSGLEWMPEVPM